LAME